MDFIQYSYFDHPVLVNAALMALTHGVYTVFLAALTMKTVYTPWVNAMSAAFTESNEWILAPRNTRFIGIHE